MENARSTDPSTRTLLWTTASSAVPAMLHSFSRSFRGRRSRRTFGSGRAGDGALKPPHGLLPDLVKMEPQEPHSLRVELIDAPRPGPTVAHQARILEHAQ